MTQPRLLVIQHNWDDSLNELGGPLVAAGLRIDTWCTFQSDDPPEPLDRFHGLLSLGGTDSVSDEANQRWIRNECALTERALADGVPILGVCFGAQMLARAAGGEIVLAPEPEIGWHLVDMDPTAAADPLFDGCGPQFHAFQFHYDTFTVPDGAVVYGTGNNMPQAFRVGSCAWGVQFHVEANPALIHAWMASFTSSMTACGVDFDQIRAFTASYWREYRRLSEHVAGAFAANVTDRARAAGV